MTKDETKERLQREGWKIEAGQHSNMAFYAWRKLHDAPNCESNEKPPCICVEYYDTKIEDGRQWQSCEVKLAGDIGNDQWVSLSAYGIGTEELFDRLPRAVAVLRAAWIAAHKGGQGQ